MKPGNYDTTEELVRSINRIDGLLRYVVFKYDRHTDMVEMKLQANVVNIEFSTTLALQLGFDPEETDLNSYKRSIRPANVRSTIPSHMYVYCDLVEPQLVGDAAAPLLRIVNIDTSRYTYGANRIVHFTDPHYVPVSRSTFESVEIDLRDGAGRNLPFQSGTTCMKLHLRNTE